MKITPALLALLVMSGCGQSGGGGPLEDVCRNFCEAVDSCTPGIKVKKVCVNKCLNVFKTAKKKGDDSLCTQANLDSFVCATGLMCLPGGSSNTGELDEFLNLQLTRQKDIADLKLGKNICNPALRDCCEQELLDVVNSCPKSVVIGL